MKRYFGILWIFIVSRLKGRFEYRAAFWMDLLFFILGYGTQAAVKVLLVSQFNTILGWSPLEVMLLYAYSLSAYTLCNAFMDGVMWDLSDNVRTGDFDQSMTKPMNPLLYEMVCSFSPYYFLHFLLSLGMIGLCVHWLGVALTAGKVAVLALSLVGGAMVQAGVLVLFAAATFILIQNPLTGDMLNKLRPVAEFPLAVFPKAVQIIYTTVLPLAFITYYPAQNMLGKNDFLLFPPVLQYGALPVGALVLFIAYHVWNRGLRLYKSTGS